MPNIHLSCALFRTFLAELALNISAVVILLKHCPLVVCLRLRQICNLALTAWLVPVTYRVFASSVYVALFAERCTNAR